MTLDDTAPTPEQGAMITRGKGPEKLPAEENDSSFFYQMLSRLKSDCEYFLGNGCRFEPHLWAGSVDAHIAEMRKYYALVPEKPDWLTEADIDLYERDMKGNYLPGDVLQIGVGEDVREYYHILSVKSVTDERGSAVTMYGFRAYWDRKLKHEKYSNTSRLPLEKQHRIIEWHDIESLSNTVKSSSGEEDGA